MSDIIVRIDKALELYHFGSAINFDLFSYEEKIMLFNNSDLINIKKKEILFEQGAYAKGMYIVRKGKIKLFQLNFDGSIQILFIYSPGDIFGYRPLITNEPSPVFAAALEDAIVEQIPATDFINTLNQTNILSNQLLQSMSKEYTVLTNRINVFAQRGIKERLALALLILNKKYTVDNQTSYFANIFLSRKDLANYIGTSLENLVRTIAFFREKKLIKTVGKNIIITHPENLLILSGIYY